MRALAELQRIDEEGEINTYDCRTCRQQGLNRTARACLFDRPTVTAWEDGMPVIVTAENYAQHAPESGLPTETYLRDVEGRAVCFVPHLAASGVIETCAREVDAKEYGMPPATRRDLELFREVRGLRYQMDREATKRRMQKA